MAAEKQSGNPVQSPLRSISQPLTAAALIVFAVFSNVSVASADNVNPMSPFMVRDRSPQKPKEQQTIEDLFPSTEIKYGTVEPLNLDYAKVPGLTPATMKMLADNLFVIVDNTTYKTMAELYKDNRLRGKSNFVTLDAIMHPYLALRNGILARVLDRYLIKDLSTLLKGMLETELVDYKAVEDADVREDIERNLAFLGIAQKLLDPNPALLTPLPAAAKSMMDQEFENIKTAKIAQSAVSGEPEDFSQYRPQGWYASSAKLRNFYRCRQYLTRFSLPLTEGNIGSSNDPFRRSTLLFRCLDNTVIDGKPAIVLWRKIYTGWVLLGSQPYAPEKSLLPSDYNEILHAQSEDTKINLNKLAEPFFRTKLLLSVKKKRPTEISSTSIFEISQKKSAEESVVTFRLFPVIQDPELGWMNTEGHGYTRPDPTIPPPPLALLDLHAHGVKEATNTIASDMSKIDPNLQTVLPELLQAVKKQPTQVLPSSWSVLRSFFQVPAETAQPVLRTKNWMTHRLATGFASWVDSQIACSTSVASSTDKSKSQVAAEPGTADVKSDAKELAPGAPTSGSAAPPATPPTHIGVHYLEPCGEVYRAMRTAQQTLADKLNAVGYFPDSMSERSTQMIDILSKCSAITEHELTGKSRMPADMRFLADIDTLLENISPPTSNTFTFDVGKKGDDDPKGAVTTGATVGLGRPGIVFIVLFTGPGRLFSLGRGAVFTQYEVAGGAISAEHWDRKLEFGFMQPAYWQTPFEVTQEQPIGGIDAATK